MKITLLGAGHIGQTIARLLGACGDYEVTVVDRSATALQLLANDPVRTQHGSTLAARAFRRRTPAAHGIRHGVGNGNRRTRGKRDSDDLTERWPLQGVFWQLC